MSELRVVGQFGLAKLGSRLRELQTDPRTEAIELFQCCFGICEICVIGG